MSTRIVLLWIHATFRSAQCVWFAWKRDPCYFNTYQIQHDWVSDV